MLAIKNGTYKKEYEKRKKDPAFMVRKRMMDQIYRDKKRRGIPTHRKTNDNAQVNQDWQAYSKTWAVKTAYNKYKAVKRSTHYHSAKERVISHYSNGKNCCASCGIADLRILDIDHINNDGAAHRREIKQMSSIWWIIRNNYPPGFQILCRNCNWLKELDRRAEEFEKRNVIQSSS